MIEVPIHLMGAIVHGRRPYAFTFLENIKHGTNITIESLYRIFAHIRGQEGGLPKKVRIQLDNTAKQNKNKYMVGWMHWLVAMRTFDEIDLHFFPVGHTHADVDQMFSRLSVRLRHHDSRSRQELLYNVREGFHIPGLPDVHGEHIERAANVSDFLEEDLSKSIKWISTFQRFRFYRLDGRVYVEGYETDMSKDPQSLTRDWVIFEKPVRPMTTETVPAAQRRYPSDNDVRLMRRGVQKAKEERELPQDCEEDILRCIDMMCDAAPLTFHWDLSVLHPTMATASVIRASQVATTWRVGDMCLIRPPDDLIQSVFFYVGEIVDWGTLSDGSKSYAAVKIQWWHNTSRHGKSDVLRGVFAMEAVDQDLVYVESLQERLAFTEKFHLSKSSKGLIVHHVANWIGPGNASPSLFFFCDMDIFLSARKAQNGLEG